MLGKRKDLTMGNIECPQSLTSEIIYLLHLKEDIDYGESKIVKFSHLTQFVLRYSFNHSVSKVGKLPDISSEEHRALQKYSNLRPDTVVYKALRALMIALCTMGGLIGTIPDRLKAVQSGEAKGLVGLEIKKTIKDVGGIEPFHQWILVLSRTEVQAVIDYLGSNIFKDQQQLLTKMREKGDLEAEKALKKQTAHVKETLPNQFFSVLYGRLKQMKIWKESNPAVFQSKDPKTGQIKKTTPKRGEWLRHCKHTGKLDLVCEISTLTPLGGIEISTDYIRAACLEVELDDATNDIVYKTKIRNTYLFKQLTSWQKDGGLSEGALSLLNHIEAKIR